MANKAAIGGAIGAFGESFARGFTMDRDYRSRRLAEQAATRREAREEAEIGRRGALEDLGLIEQTKNDILKQGEFLDITKPQEVENFRLLSMRQLQGMGAAPEVVEGTISTAMRMAEERLKAGEMESKKLDLQRRGMEARGEKPADPVEVFKNDWKIKRDIVEDEINRTMKSMDPMGMGVSLSPDEMRTSRTKLNELETELSQIKEIQNRVFSAPLKEQAGI